MSYRIEHAVRNEPPGNAPSYRGALIIQNLPSDEYGNLDCKELALAILQCGRSFGHRDRLTVEWKDDD